MTKAELLTQIESDSLGVVHVQLQEEGTMQNGTTYKKYNANVFAKEGESQNFVNIPFTVLDEGGAGEDAFLTQGKNAPKLDQARKAVAGYMDSQADVIRYVIGQVNEVTRDARVTAIVSTGANTATEEQWVVYKDGSNPVNHVVLS